MQRELFSKDYWASAKEKTLRLAVRDVEALDRRVIADPGLAGQLEKIAAKYSFEVAKLAHV
jgi:hypothetical protein